MSFISQGQQAFITKQMRRLQATKLVLQDGGMELVLSRWNDLQGKMVALPAQQVTVTFDNTQLQDSGSESGRARRITGKLTKETPFDVEVGDLFAYGPPGDEQQATIDLVQPIKLGRQSARFNMVVGEQ